MPLNVMLLVLLGALLHASWNTAVKAAGDKFLDTTLIFLGAAVVIALFLPFVSLPKTESWPWLVISVFVHVVYVILVSAAYQTGDLSLVYPLMRGFAPAITAILTAGFLKETPGVRGWLGILAVSGGILLLTLDASRSVTACRKATLFALANSAVIVAYTVIDGIGARLSGNAFSYTGWVILLQALFVGLFTVRSRGSSAIQYFKRNWLKGLGGGICTFGSYSLALWAMTQAPIALVAALRETSIVFGTIFAAWILRERVSRLRLLSILIVVLGAILIKLS